MCGQLDGSALASLSQRTQDINGVVPFLKDLNPPFQLFQPCFTFKTFDLNRETVFFPFFFSPAVPLWILLFGDVAYVIFLFLFSLCKCIF